MNVPDYVRPEGVMSPAEHAVDQLDLESLRRVLDAGGDPNERIWQGMTLLMAAVDAEACLLDDGLPVNVSVTALLLARGADVSLRMDDGTTALDMAERRNHWLAVELIRAWESGRPGC